MVQLEEVEDESFVTGEKVFEEDDDDYEDTDSEISEDEEYDLDPSESIFDRIVALKDIIPPTTRHKLADGIETTVAWTKSGLWLGGKTVFILSTSALLIGVPFGLAVAEESQAMEFEREQKMREMGNEMLGGGQASDAGQGVAQGQAKAAL